VKDGLFPPQEVFIHTEVYRARPDVVSVVHVHPPAVVLFTIADVPLLPIFGAYDPSALKIATDAYRPTTAPSSFRIPHLGHDLAAALGDKNVLHDARPRDQPPPGRVSKRPPCARFRS